MRKRLNCKGNMTISQISKKKMGKNRKSIDFLVLLIYIYIRGDQILLNIIMQYIIIDTMVLKVPSKERFLELVNYQR